MLLLCLYVCDVAHQHIYPPAFALTPSLALPKMLTKQTLGRGGAFLNTGRGRGRKSALEFVEEGSLQRQAEIMRLKQKYGE